MTGGDRGLQHVRPRRLPDRLGARQRRQAAADEQPVPARAVLVEQQHRLSGRADARLEARGPDLHHRNEAVHLRLLRRELGEDAAQAQRVLAQAGAQPVVARGRGIAFVEHEIDDPEHRAEAAPQLLALRHRERHARRGERALGAHDALRDRRLRHQEGARDLLGRQARDQAQGERDARLGREQRMARDEHQAQQVVADVVVEGGVDRLDDVLPLVERAADLRVLALEQLHAAQPVDRAVPGGGHEPGARTVRDARLGPPLERRDQGVLRQLLGEADVAHDAREAGDEPRRFDAPDRVDRAIRLGSRHGCRSDQRIRAAASGARLECSVAAQLRSIRVVIDATG
jgi:hypothetical protein